MDHLELEAVATRAAVKAVEEVQARNAAAYLTTVDAKKLVEETVKLTLLQIGIDHADPMQMQADFQHLRKWRRAGEDIRSKGLTSLITIVVGGVAALLVIGFKHWS